MENSTHQKNSIPIIKRSLTSLAFMSSTSLLANTAEEEEYFQSVIGMEKKALINDFIHLEVNIHDKFWILYDLYETNRKEINAKRMDLLYHYMHSYDHLNDSKIDQLITEIIKHKNNADQLLTRYYKKIRKVAGPRVAGQFLQIEAYFLSAIAYNILDSAPLIPEN